MTEAQRVLLSTSLLSRERHACLSDHFCQLRDLLIRLLPEAARRGFDADGLAHLVKDSANIASDIRLCPTTYRFIAHLEPRNAAEPTALYEQDMGRYNLIDQAKSQPVQSTDVINAVPDGKIGTLRCVIHHALVRKGKAGGRDITLVKPTILCSFDSPVTRRKRVKQGISESEENRQTTGEGGRRS
jgi:hypothetical protein